MDINLLHLTGRNIPNIWLGKECKEAFYCFNRKQLLEKIAESLNEKSVVVVGLSPRRLSKDGRKGEKQLDRMSGELQRSLDKLVDVVKQKGGKLIVVEGLPQIKCRNNQSMQILYNMSGAIGVEKECNRDRENVNIENMRLDQILANLSKSNPEVVKTFRTREYICSSTSCSMTNSQGRLMYWDELAHLTTEGLEQIKTELQKKINSTLKEAKKNGDIGAIID